MFFVEVASFGEQEWGRVSYCSKSSCVSFFEVVLFCILTIALHIAEDTSNSDLRILCFEPIQREQQNHSLVRNYSLSSAL